MWYQHGGMRSLVLSLRILGRTLGWVPVVGLLLWCAIASLQEPDFFRRQGLDLAWPAIYGGADILCLAIALAWCHSGSEERFRPFATTRSWLIHAGAVLVACLVAHTVAMSAAILIDMATLSTTPWPALPRLFLRTLCVWLPLSLLVSALAGCSRPVARLVITGCAFAIMATIHPVSLLYEPATLAKLSGSALAILATGLIALDRPADPTD